MNLLKNKKLGGIMNNKKIDELLFNLVKNQTVLQIQIQSLIKVLLNKKIVDESEINQEIELLQEELLKILEEKNNSIGNS
ncbi:MAG: hypothetical protein QXN52_08895 [Nitrososphaerota archaeon]